MADQIIFFALFSTSVYLEQQFILFNQKKKCNLGSLEGESPGGYLSAQNPKLN